MAALAHVGIYVEDLARSVVFYGEVFGFQVARTMVTSTSKIAFLDVGGGTLELIQRPGAPGKTEGPWSHVAFKVDDYDAMESRLEGLGVELRKVVLGDGSRIAFFKDPDGHDVEIME
jgi:catechol 2,3-dioxygenase-like lactoylglutathione lyase family enzyme